ncbi:ABC transporter permease [Halobacillus litoralis]|uniref:ABC transporter permease n=1 Tax=Halobacillus litoralis TaxID=45668 RepID=UPI001CD527A4|nr:ABC transporter permease [Halobacillus litoralis]MCA0970573.1 ABC transporter permease [Halobacillus litoralis]
MFTIAMKDVWLRLKDKRGLVSMLLMPILLTAILGSALSGNFSESASMPDTTVGVTFDEDDSLSKQWVEETMPGDEVSVVTFADREKVEKALEKQEVDVGVLLPDMWGQKMATADVTVLTDPDKTMQASIVEAVLHAYIDRVNAVGTTAEQFAEELSAVGGVEVTPETENLVSDMSVLAQSNEGRVATATDGGTSVTGMQYYAAAMGVMFLLFNATIGARSILEERHSETLARLAMTPHRSFHIIGGKFIGTLLFSLVQFGLFLAATHLMFQVSWGTNLLQVFAIGFTYAFAVSGIAMMLAGIVKEEKTVDSIGGIGVQILALLGGSMIPVAAFPDAIQIISNAIPNNWALDQFVHVMTGAAWSDLILSMTALVMVGLGTLILGWVRLQVR